MLRDFTRATPVAAAMVALTLVITACSTDTFRSVTGPTAIGNVIGGSSAGASRTLQSTATNGLRLIAVVGSGSGTFTDEATASDHEGTLNAQLTINVHGTSPNTTLYLVRAGDIGLPNGQQGDGICQRASLGFFQPVPTQPGGATATLQTSNGGSGALHLELNATGAEGTRIDAVYRLVDALPPAAPTIDLRTPCFTFTVN